MANVNGTVLLNGELSLWCFRLKSKLLQISSTLYFGKQTLFAMYCLSVLFKYSSRTLRSWLEGLVICRSDPN